MNSLPLSDSRPRIGNGNAPRNSTRASNTHFWALFRTAFVSVQPVKTSATVKVWANSPRGSPPSSPTRSISTNPGAFSSHWTQVRIGIWDFSKLPGLVPERPFSCRSLRSQPAGDRSWPPTSRTASRPARRPGLAHHRAVAGPRSATGTVPSACPPARPSPPTPCATRPSRLRRTPEPEPSATPRGRGHGATPSTQTTHPEPWPVTSLRWLIVSQMSEADPTPTGNRRSHALRGHSYLRQRPCYSGILGESTRGLVSSPDRV